MKQSAQPRPMDPVPLNALARSSERKRRSEADVRLMHYREMSEFMRVVLMDSLTRLAERGRTCTFPAGSQLQLQGEMSVLTYVLLSGRVQVQLAHLQLTEPFVVELGPGDLIDEPGLLDQMPPTAVVMALEDCEALDLDATAFAETALRFPEVSTELPRLLTHRMRDAEALAG